MNKIEKGFAVGATTAIGLLAGAGLRSTYTEYIRPEVRAEQSYDLGDVQSCQAGLTGIVYVDPELPASCQGMSELFPTCQEVYDRGPSEEQGIADQAPALQACAQAENIRGEEALDDYAFSQAIFANRTLYRVVSQEQDDQSTNIVFMLGGALVGFAAGAEVIHRKRGN